MNKLWLVALLAILITLIPLRASAQLPLANDTTYTCKQAGDTASFTVTCTQTTLAPEPVYWYVACDVNDATCASGRFPVRWDYALKAGGERCALQSGAVVEPQAYMEAYDGTPLAWVVTQNDAGGIPCAGWIPEDWLNAVYEDVP